MEPLLTHMEQMLDQGADKFILSKPKDKSATVQKIVVDKLADYYQIASYTQKQVFHENHPHEGMAQRLVALIDGQFLQVNAFAPDAEHMLMVSKKGALSYKKRPCNNQPTAPVTHNRKKQYILAQGEIIPPLVDMGIFTKEGKIVQSMYDKYRQINRFLEIIDDELKTSKATSLNIIDFGCGKSYLTFIVYHYLTQIKGIQANIIGLDLKADVIEKCNASAQKYGYDGLRFELGDINGFHAPFDVDMVLTLHACDTATDFALYNAISWQARLIFSVPCCQHEFNAQMTPAALSILGKYGILQERFAALSTDAIRANLLEYSGYRTQVLEFVDLSHTPKNVLIRAVRRPLMPKGKREKALAEVEELMQTFGFEPTLYKLLGLEN